MNYTAAQIRAALIHYTRNIGLININGDLSNGLGIISLERSILTDTYPSNLTQQDAEKRRSIDIIATTNTTGTVGTETPTLSNTTIPPKPNSTTNIIPPTATSITCQSFVQVYLSVTFERHLANDERLIFDNSSSTLQDLTTTLQNRITSNFPNSFINLDILLFSDKPILIPNITNNETNDKKVIITIIGRVYFVQNQSSAAVHAAFANCTQPITLLNLNNPSNSALANFSSMYSLFTDMFSRQLASRQTNDLIILCQNTSRTSPTTVSASTTTHTTSTSTSTTTSAATTSETITTTGTTTTTEITSFTTSTNASIISSITTPRCQSFTQAYISVILVLTVTGNETPEFYNITITIEELNTTLNERFQSYFPQSFLKFNVLMISNEPIIISSTNNRRKKRATDQTGIIIIIGSAYFVQNQSREEIGMSLQNYQLYVSLKDMNGQASARLSVFSLGYTIFRNTSSIESTQKKLMNLLPFVKRNTT